MRSFSVILFVFCLFAILSIGCVREVQVPPAGESNSGTEPAPVAPKTVKSKPTWDIRSFSNWRKVECGSSDSSSCQPMGRATMLVEFVHNGCRTFKQTIDNQAALIQGYAPEHLFILVDVSIDALTNILYDSDKTCEPPCRVFFYDDMVKSDGKFPNEDQKFVELCKDATVITDQECRGQLRDVRLYAP